MSAIWGSIDFGAEKSHVYSMTDEYKRKCRLDGITERHFGDALFGFGLQSINDEDEYEEAPYIVDDGNTIITADCILDNRDELIKEFSLNIEPSHISDGRLICLAYEKWHYDLAKHLRGLFSIAIYNTAIKELFLCVDQTASRCLYYHVRNNAAIFSTLISPIKQVYKDIPQNEQYYIDFLTLPGLDPNANATDTPFEKVYMIEAGCNVIISGAEDTTKVRVERYYHLPTRCKHMKIEDAKKEFRQAFAKAAEAATRTNGETSVFLSSGFDSSSVAAYSAKALALKGKNLYSYTYVPYYKMSAEDYPPNYIMDETEDVKRFAERYPNIITSFEDGGGKDCLQAMPLLLDIMEIPYKAYVNLATFSEVLDKASKNGSKVMLTGQVGNSTVSFGNINDILYHLYSRGKYLTFIRYYSKYCKLCGISRKANFKGMLSLMQCYDRALQCDGSELNQDNNELFNPYINKELFKKSSFDNRISKDKPLTVEEYDEYCYSTKAFAYLGAMETKLGLYSGVVLRDETRNLDIIEFCARVPYEYFCYDGVPRFFVRGTLDDMIPEHILYPIDRYGMQSCDWLKRISVNSERFWNDFIKSLENEKCLDRDKIKEFLKSPLPIETQNAKNYQFLLVIYLLTKYKELKNTIV